MGDDIGFIELGDYRDGYSVLVKGLVDPSCHSEEERSDDEESLSNRRHFVSEAYY